MTMQTDNPNIDENSFRDLLIDHEEMVFRYVVLLAPQRADADELYQQACLTMWEKWSEGIVPDHFGAWARAIIRNHWRNFLRQRKRSPGLLTDELLESIEARSQLTDRFSKEKMFAMERCIDALPAEYQTVINAYYQHGVTVEKVARRLDRPVQGLYKLLQRIRKRIMECVQLRLKRDDVE